MSLLLLFLSAGAVTPPATPPAGASIRIRNEWRQEVERIKPDSEFGTKRGKGRAVELLEAERQEVAKPQPVKAKAARKAPKPKLVAPSIEAETTAAVAASDASAAIAQQGAELQAQADAQAAADLQTQIDAQMAAQAAVDAVQAAIEAERQRMFAIAQIDDLDLMMIG